MQTNRDNGLECLSITPADSVQSDHNLPCSVEPGALSSPQTEFYHHEFHHGFWFPPKSLLNDETEPNHNQLPNEPWQLSGYSIASSKNKNGSSDQSIVDSDFSEDSIAEAEAKITPKRRNISFFKNRRALGSSEGTIKLNNLALKANSIKLKKTRQMKNAKDLLAKKALKIERKWRSSDEMEERQLSDREERILRIRKLVKAKRANLLRKTNKNGESENCRQKTTKPD